MGLSRDHDQASDIALEKRMNLPEHEELQRAGAQARALGRHELDNPFYRAEHMPAASGEPPGVWEAKLRAWELGWRAEDAMSPT